MAVISNLATLTTEVGNYLARTDTNLVDEIPNFIQNTENKLYRTLKLRDMETDFSTVISNGTITIPLRYVSLKYAYVDESPVQILQRVAETQLYELYPDRTGSGIPQVIAEETGNFIFGPFPDSNYTITGIYYQSYEPLRTTDGNFVVVNAPEVLLYGALVESGIFLRDLEMISFWKGFFDEAVETLLQEKRMEENSGSSPQAKAQ